MPGIVGFTVTPGMLTHEFESAVMAMRRLITHGNFYVDDPPFIDTNICATRAHVNIVRKEPQPCRADDIFVWMDGEFFNGEEMRSSLGIEPRGDPEIFLECYRLDKSLSFLDKIDGFYSAVIYDRTDGKVHLMADRYGMRHLYWTVYHGCLWWGSEVKAVLALPGFAPIIDRRAVDEFFGAGYLLENRTWFEGVELLPTGSFLTWEIDKLEYSTKRYWWWDNIRPLEGRINEDEAAEEMGRLFSRSVQRRFSGDDKVGLLLSGGLDSRAILAAAPPQKNPDAITFGRKGSDDIRIAAMAASKGGAPHTIFNIDHSNWLNNRIKAVWWTDGQMSFLEMHAMIAADCLRDIYHINLNGYAGDLVLGGSYLTEELLETGNRKRAIADFMDCSSDLIPSSNDYDGLSSTDYFFLQNRVRRFTYEGSRFVMAMIDQRKPFFDNNLIDFSYSLPDRLRMGANIYKKMLLRFFPDFFRTIPWQKTGAPISCSPAAQKLSTFASRIRNKLSSEIRRMGIDFLPSKGYTDYPGWIRSEPGKSFFENILRNPEALYPQFISADSVNNDLEMHFRGKNLSINLCRAITLEIWLQQVFNNKYRDE